MRTTVKVSEVWDTRTKFKAVVECRGVNNEGCWWEPPGFYNDREKRKAVKDHITVNPNHRVVVTVEDITTYYVPSAILGKEDE